MKTPPCPTLDNQQVHVESFPHEPGRSALRYTDPEDIRQEARDTPPPGRILETPEQPYSRCPVMSHKPASLSLPKIESRSPDASQCSPSFGKLLGNGGTNLDAYGVTELSDGFFDAVFNPVEVDRKQLLKQPQTTLPAFSNERSPLSFKNFFPRHWHGVRRGFRHVLSTRRGIGLAKTFLAFLMCYILCFIPAMHRWLGRYCLCMVVSAIICHPSRTVGAQIEGALLTIIGTVIGLGWGVLALFVSTWTPTAGLECDGMLAALLVVFMGLLAVIQSSWTRLYQLVLCAGIAATYACLSPVTCKSMEWTRFCSYGISWILGQVVSLVSNLAIFPDMGVLPIVITTHSTLKLIKASPPVMPAIPRSSIMLT